MLFVVGFKAKYDIFLIVFPLFRNRLDYFLRTDVGNLDFHKIIIVQKGEYLNKTEDIGGNFKTIRIFTKENSYCIFSSNYLVKWKK